jgi:hypothetical protein
MNLQPSAVPQQSPGWVRPYSTGDGGIGMMGGYQTRGGTSVNANVYVPQFGPPSANPTVTVPTR